MIEDAVYVAIEDGIVRGDQVDCSGRGIALAANAEDREAPFGFDHGWSLSWAADAVARRPSIGVSDAEDHSNAGVSVVKLDAVEMVEF